VAEGAGGHRGSKSDHEMSMDNLEKNRKHDDRIGRTGDVKKPEGFDQPGRPDGGTGGVSGHPLVIQPVPRSLSAPAPKHPQLDHQPPVRQPVADPVGMMAKAIADRVLGPGLAHKVGAALQDLATRHALHHHPDEPSQSINVMDLPKVAPTPPSSAANHEPDQPINVMDLPKANHGGEVLNNIGALNNVLDGYRAPAHHASGGYDHATELSGASFIGAHYDAPETSAAFDPGHAGVTNHAGAMNQSEGTNHTPAAANYTGDGGYAYQVNPDGTYVTELSGASFIGAHYDAPETSAAFDPGHAGVTNHAGADGLGLDDEADAGLDGGGHAA
jgi:hypothetical protein